jgi:hypothetical protein
VRWNGRSIRRLLGNEPYLPREIVLETRSVQTPSRATDEKRKMKGRKKRETHVFGTT